MTKAFVHGNPETAAIWTELIAELGRLGVTDIVTLSPPGFGAPLPGGWDPTAPNYVEWLAAEVGDLSRPVDLVGHDWGAGHVFGLAASRPELIRSFAADVPGLLHPGYEWHDMAQLWQTPGIGEETVAAMAAMPAEEAAAGYVALGMSATVATEVAEAMNTEMAACILGLYRSAQQPYLADCGRALAGAPPVPSLLINPTADAYASPDLTPDVARNIGADTLDLVDQGHWWMCSPAAVSIAAEGLANFWSNLDG